MECKLQQSSVTLSQKEAEEYCAYKRQKKISEIMSAMRRVESVLTGSEDMARSCERAARLKLGAVQLTPMALEQWGDTVRRRPVKIDCVIGGDGETLSKVKAYEAKRVMRLGARELTLRIAPSLVASSRYTQLRKELRRLRKAAGSAILKVRIEKTLPHASLSRLLRVACEGGADYFSLPYYEGCERLQCELVGNCLLEVSGVENLSVFQKMAGAGMGRIVTTRAWEMYCEWVREAEKIALEEPSAPSVEKANTPTERTGEPSVEKGTENAREKPLLLPPPRRENAV